MALQGSGAIKFSEIESEFGSNGERSLGSYRVSQDIGGLSSLPLDQDAGSSSNTDIPSSGAIKFSNFYNAKLNVVVDCHSGSTENRIIAKNDKWNNNNVTVVGGFRSKKEAGSRVIIHVNKTFGSTSNTNQQICALRTGSWDSSVALQVDIGSSGAILGAGGDGGDGADGYSDYGPVTGSVGAGSNGNSALGIQHNPTTVNVVSGGQIRTGYGGGGGGQGGRQVDSGADRTACGGGGGGGGGTPPGAAGEGGQRLSGGGDEVASGSDGGAGSNLTDPGPAGGAGGAGGNNANEAIGATGGVGGDSEQSPGAGGSVYNGKNTYGGNGAAGASGAAIRRTSGYTVTVNNSGTVEGSTTATGVA